MTEILTSKELDLAILFHEIYERLAPSFGYETRTDTRTFDPESKNGRLMVAVCGEILKRLTPETNEGCMEGAVYDCIERRLGLTYDGFSSRPRYLFILDAIDLLMQQARPADTGPFAENCAKHGPYRLNAAGCPVCWHEQQNALKAAASHTRCEWGCHVHWSGWPTSHHPNCIASNGNPR
jgi:hypothetical protein